MRRALAVLAVLLTAHLFTASASAALKLVRFAGGFVQPVHVASTPADRWHVYVVEQRGVIKRVASGGASTTFLDIRDSVSCCGEQGLLSLAFHPSYATNRKFYVYYTNVNGDIRVAEFLADSTLTQGVRSSFRRLVAIDHPPATNHNGGQVAFSRLGYLYIGTGDGGGSCDPGNRSQNLSSPLGKLLRLDVNASGATPTIMSYGLRNPWRFSFDRANGDLYVADVGQSRWEEVDRVRYGAPGRANFGWDVYEGTEYDTCNENKTLNLPSGTYYSRPIRQYSHTYGCSITGGFVYRGSAIASMRGRYLFGDYCNGRVWSFPVSDPSRLASHTNLTVPENLSSFGEGPLGGLYLVSHNGGVVYAMGES